MNAEQPVIKKVLVKKVKVLVKRPVASPVAGGMPAAAPVVKKVIKKVVPVQAVPVQPAPRPSFTQSVKNVQENTPLKKKADNVKPLSYQVPDDIIGAVSRKKKIPEKLLALYIYTRVYTESVANQGGYQYPAMMIELPSDTQEATQLFEEIDDTIFEAIIDDFAEMAPFVNGLEKVMRSKAPLDRIVEVEMAKAEKYDDIPTDLQIVLSYLMVLADMQTVQQKLDLLDVENEAAKIFDEIQNIEDEEKEIKEAFIKAIERKQFPVDARRLIQNYFNLAKKDSEKAYHTLITNPLYFSPIQMEKMPRKMFGLVKPSAKDALLVNKQLASFLKKMKA